MNNCPFCGWSKIKLSQANKRIWRDGKKGKYFPAFRYYCAACKGTTDSYLKEKEARDAWNRRVK